MSDEQVAVPTTIVVLDAVDWGVYPPQAHWTNEFEQVKGRLVGWLMAETETHYTIAQQWFPRDGNVRAIMTIPKVCVHRCTKLEAGVASDGFYAE